MHVKKYTRTITRMRTRTIVITRTRKIIKTRTKKYRIRETLNLSTDADHRTNIFFWGGMVKIKKIKKINIYM